LLLNSIYIQSSIFVFFSLGDKYIPIIAQHIIINSQDFSLKAFPAKSETRNKKNGDKITQRNKKIGVFRLSLMRTFKAIT
jgi:hypothetical protein